MKPTLEERLRDYADTLDEAAAARAAVPARSAVPAALVSALVPRARGVGKRRVVAALAVLSIIVAASATTMIVARRGRTSTTGGPTPTTTTTTLGAAPPTTVGSDADGLRALFTRTTPNGIVISARAGLVPLAAALQADACPVIPVPSTQPPSPDCAPGTAPGVQFEFSTDGHTYQVTVLNRDIALNRDIRHAGGPDLEPMITLADLREVLPNGDSVVWRGGPSPYLVILYATHIADVRIDPTRTAASGLDEMAPVRGWVAFAASSSASDPFDNTVQGLDSAGTVITTALPWRCC